MSQEFELWLESTWIEVTIDRVSYHLVSIRSLKCIVGLVLFIRQKLFQLLVPDPLTILHNPFNSVLKRVQFKLHDL